MFHKNVNACIKKGCTQIPLCCIVFIIWTDKFVRTDNKHCWHDYIVLRTSTNIQSALPAAKTAIPEYCIIFETIIYLLNTAPLQQINQTGNNCKLPTANTPKGVLKSEKQCFCIVQILKYSVNSKNNLTNIINFLNLHYIIYYIMCSRIVSIN